VPEDRQLLKTSLHSKHVAAGAKMGDEAGWEMPLSYRGALAEAQEVRNRGGLFDISHLGRIRIRGDGAVDLLERVCTADAAGQEDDTAAYTLLCNDRGGIIDHCMLARAEGFWLLTASAMNRHKVLDHLQARAGDFDVKIDDQTERTAHVAVAGPAAADMLDAVLPQKVSAMPPGAVKVGSLMIARYIVMRVGYCGEWSLEAIMPNMVAGQAWRFITEKAGANRIAPAGLLARDVLRIEAGLCRYGHELNETIDPVTAGLAAAVDFEHEFIGRDAVRAIREKGPSRKRVALVFAAPSGPPEATSIPKMGAPVSRSDGHEAGAVTSATYSPMLDRIIALAYVAADAAEAGTKLFLRSGAQLQPARIVDLPFAKGM